VSEAVGEPLRPTLRLLSAELVGRILDEAHELLLDPGVRVQDAEAVDLLAGAGARVDGEIARLPAPLVEKALASAPASFDLFDRSGRPAVRYGAGVVQFDPGSSGVNFLDPATGDHRPSRAEDLVRLVRVAEMLPAYAAQSTAIVCNDVPAEIGDLYRLFLVLLGSAKPVVTGAFSARGTAAMIDLLALDAGGRDALAVRPRAVFDVCPSPPLTWTAFGARNLVELARARVPAEMVSMPLAGGTAPVTLVGSVVQHAAECLAGIAIHQLAAPGAPIVWGGAPSIVDMRTGATPMGAIETAMLDAAYAQVGQHLGLPTHGYLSATDGKVVDHQAGLESGVSALIGALAGIDMISGAGMLDSLRCQSVEKLVLDAEGIAMAQRLLRGVAAPTATLATEALRAAGWEARFLELPETRRLFRSEQALPSPVVDRASLRAWQEAGRPDAATRARARVSELLAAYKRPDLGPAVEAAMVELVREAGAPFGLSRELPGLDAARA
jgi:trimethylamine--corrinoid protein Co-methyltransferase